ncbi:hypothetical protein Tco_1044907 [Tanacetum coccineum]|uniref:Uncharacterized protein n=1 Tax=Tanacetum coccineum TaxID=301880 RepID=A0ABQ5GR87_9ASTR
MILTHLLQKSLKLRRPQPGRLLTLEKLILAPPNIEDTVAAHLPKIKTRYDWLKPATAISNAYKDPEENKLTWKTRDMGSFIKWYCKWIGNSKLSKADLEGPAFKQTIASRRSTRSVTIQPQYFFNKDLEYLVSGNKERRNALSISKLKAAYFQDFRLEELVPSLWIESEREYDISPSYGISHWWFKRKEFYITRHGAPFDRCAVRSHMKILNVVSLKTFS